MSKKLNANVDFNNPVEFMPWVQKLVDFLRVEDWHTVGATGEPAFENSWANRAGNETAAFYKDPFDRVHLKGSVDTGTSGTTVFTLPENYRPAGVINFVAQSPGASSSYKIHITAAGAVIAQDGTTNGTSLDGISFRAEQ